jgi:hypothetical protein
MGQGAGGAPPIFWQPLESAPNTPNTPNGHVAPSYTVSTLEERLFLRVAAGFEAIKDWPPLTVER